MSSSQLEGVRGVSNNNEINNHIKYTRSPLLDESRCTIILSNGMRCALRRVTSGVICYHHHRTNEHKGANSETGYDS